MPSADTNDRLLENAKQNTTCAQRQVSVAVPVADVEKRFGTPDHDWLILSSKQNSAHAHFH